MTNSPWPLRSGSLVLRYATPEDVEQLLTFRNDPGVNRFMIRTTVEPEQFRREWAAIPDSHRDFSCVAEREGQVVAMGFLEVVDGMGQPGKPMGTEGRIGYIVDPAHAGRGVATDVARGLLRAGFEVLGLRRITAGCNADNHASVRVLEKVGMRREQHGVQDSWHAELGWVDGYEYGLLAHEWRDKLGRVEAPRGAAPPGPDDQESAAGGTPGPGA